MKKYDLEGTDVKAETFGAAVQYDSLLRSIVFRILKEEYPEIYAKVLSDAVPIVLATWSK